MRWLAEFVARAAGRLSRRLGRGGGTTLPGVVLLKLRPHGTEELAKALNRGCIVISGTNGKTTTARLVRSTTDAAGYATVANTSGSNLLRGITTALLSAHSKANMGIFEVDEAALPSVVKRVRPRAAVLMNLFRDQLDRYGELETLVQTWRSMISELQPGTTLVLNADDPAVAFLGDGRTDVVYFGVDDPGVGRAQLDHAVDSTRCPRCETVLAYSLITIGHMGHWSCPSCGLKRPEASVSATRVSLDGLDGLALRLSTPAGPVRADLSLAGLHSAYNATAAVAAAQVLGVSVEQIGPALARTEPAFGRGERVRVGGIDLMLMLAKNPTGANENIRTAMLDENDLHIFALLNDRTADGQDVSWIWDVDYEPMFDRVASLTISGDRAHDLALRFVYGGFDAQKLHIEPDIRAALDHAISATSDGATIYALPTYTAMLDLREDLVRRGVTHAFWEET